MQLVIGNNSSTYVIKSSSWGDWALMAGAGLASFLPEEARRIPAAARERVA
jgi:hypothetical protein